MNQALKELIESHHNIVFFGGAGVSTESGIPDFRSKDGLYAREDFKYPPEQMLSRSFFDSHPKDFFDFYRKILLAPNKGPSKIHYKLAELEKEGKLSAIITQNIDGLHQQAGSQKVFELHGSILRNYCMKCHKFYSEDTIRETDGIPLCEHDKGIIKPDVVLYEESLDNHVIAESISHLQKADMLIIAGTSLAVYPAAGLIDYFKGDTIVIINLDPTPRDKIATLLIHGSISQALCD